MWGTRRDQVEAVQASARRSGGFSRRWSTPSAAQGPGQPRPMSRVGRPRRPWFAHRRRHEAKLHAAAHVVGCLLVPLRTLVEAVWQPHSAHTCRFQGREVTPSPTPYPSRAISYSQARRAASAASASLPSGSSTATRSCARSTALAASPTRCRPSRPGSDTKRLPTCHRSAAV